MRVELCGIPGGGKSTLVRRYAEQRREAAVVTLSMYNKLPTLWYGSQFILFHPIAFIALLIFVARFHMRGLFFYSLHLMLRACAKYQKAQYADAPVVLIDEGLLHILSGIPARPLTEKEMRFWVSLIPHPDAAFVATTGSFHRFHNAEANKHPRVQQGPDALASWEAAVRENVATLNRCLRSSGVEVHEIERHRVPELRVPAASKISPKLRKLLVLGAFLLFAGVGLLMSFLAPYEGSDDELVYLTGALQAEEGTLPDAYMLQGYEYGPYLYPHIMVSVYEDLGFYTFKSIVLVVLVLATGYAAYGMFRLLGLSWIPALLLALVALIPRVSAGTEFFGILTFHEAIGRSMALPLFFLGTGVLIQRLVKKQLLWPVFAGFGLFLFLHPVTVMIFATLALLGVIAVQLVQKVPLLNIVRTVLVSGITFMITGCYFFVEVFSRLSHGVVSEGVSTAAYVEAVLFRNLWEFPAASLDWYRHMAVVSVFFVGFLVVWYLLPWFRNIRERYQLPNAKSVLVYGITIAASALVVTLLLPGVNLYLMEHADAPYIFQQWSRASKFYYLGIFVALVPAVYTLWGWYRSTATKWKHLAVLILLAGAAASSSVAFEVAQYAIGYQNYSKSYVPQALSGAPDAITPDEYREVCEKLIALGATSSTKVVSGDFAFRYYCRADLYATQEEGAAYLQLTRKDLVEWYDALMAQRAALNSTDPATIRAFANSVDASFVIVPRGEKFQVFETFDDVVVRTSKHIIYSVE